MTSTSTPTNSPQPPPLPPRTCQPLQGPSLPPEHSSHSPACTDLSSIDGDVFDQETDPSLSVSLRPANFRYHAKTLMTGTMEEPERDLIVAENALL